MTWQYLALHSRATCRHTDIGVDWPFELLVPEDRELFKSVPFDSWSAHWITDLVNSHLVEAVPKFSKFILGCATPSAPCASCAILAPPKLVPNPRS
jgi:SPX domain protein involved in polyphosphate accumulation